MTLRRFCSFLLVLSAIAAFAGMAHADATAVIEALDRTSKEKMVKTEMVIDKQIKAMEDSFNDMKKAIAMAEDDGDLKPAGIQQVISSLNELPKALALTDSLVNLAMYNQLRMQNRVPLNDKGTVRADYLVDSTYDAGVDVQAFDIFMRYFCDPNSRNGYWKDGKITLYDFVKNDGTVLDEHVLKCGSTDTSGMPSRKSILQGASDVGVEADQIISLPTRPEKLFFAPDTFPTAPVDGSAPTDTSANSNTNRMANLYYSAFQQSMLYLIPKPPEKIEGTKDIVGDSPALLNQQAVISRNMMATYPFALLFAERSGTMGEIAAEQTAKLLARKLGKGTQDVNILARIKNIQRRKSISVAEYMDIVMYQLLMSPGYYERINKELNRAQLQREIVWLTAQQTALNYQSNRWLEILAAIEAVK